MRSISERWLDIPGYWGYQASDLGRIRSVSRTILSSRNGKPYRKSVPARILRQRLAATGYLEISISPTRQSQKTTRVHKLVLLAWVGSRSKGLHINHKNGIKIDNRLCNLEYVTASENVRHAHQTGLASVLYGEKHANSKLTEKLVKYIRNVPPAVSSRKLAAQLGLGTMTVWNARNCRSWKHV